MSKVKVSELKGTALDWAVAIAKGIPAKELRIPAEKAGSLFRYLKDENQELDGRYLTGPDLLFSRRWFAGGPIIESEGICLEYDKEWVYDPENVDPDDEPDNGDRWRAWSSSDQTSSEYGPSPLVAAMRCFVACKLGAEIEIPKNLT